MTKDEKRSFRATFLDNKSAQQKLTEWIDNLVEDNKPLDPEDRPKFARLLANATLGEGSKVELGDELMPKLEENDWEIDGIGSHIKPKTAGDVARFAMYETSNEIELKRGTVPISQLWASVRALMHEVYPLALQKAVASSAERIPYSKQEPTKDW